MPVIPEEAYQFKNLILSDKYLDEQSKLTAIIGVNDKEEPILFDFAKNTHLFIGGDQGCGKSTLIHSIIISLMQRNTPEEFQFVYLDAKGLDVNLYKQSKYLHISREHHILDVFNYLLQECDNRGRILSENKKKTVSAYNEFAALCDDVQTIPELFIILDEVSSFIDDVKHYIEQLITHGRTVGIHLIISDTNPTLVNVLRIAKHIPNKIVFRFTYSDYKALLERKNVVPLSDDGEILCDFRGAEYVHGYACFVSEDEIKQEVAKNIVEIKKEKPVKKKKVEPKEVLQPIEEPDLIENKMPYEALINKDTFDSKDYPEYSKMLKELGIVDVDKVTGPQKITVTNVKHKAKLLGISEELAEFYGDITLNVRPASDSDVSSQADEPQEETKPEEKRFQSFFKNFVAKHLVFSILASITAILIVMNLIFSQETKVQFIILAVAIISVLLSFVIRDMLKWKNRDPNIPDSGAKNPNIRYVYIVVTALIAIIALFFFLNLEKEVLKIAGIIIAVIALFIAAVYFLILASESRGKSGASYNIYTIDNLSDGHTFEYVVADLLKGVGFYNVRVTVGSGDYGIDVVGDYDGASYAIQCKKYSGKVGVSAVQEAFAGRSYYGCNYAMVITNNYFTPAAIKLAESTGVILWDRNNVKRLINGHI